MKILHQWTMEESASRKCSCKKVVYENKIHHCDGKGLMHCEQGPAIVCSTGLFIFYSHGKKHRLDGPSEYDPGGTPMVWYDVNGKAMSMNQFADHYLMIYLKLYDFSEEKRLGVVS